MEKLNLFSIGILIIVSSVFLVYATGEPEGSMTIDEFLVLNDSILYDFNVTFLLMSEVGLDTYYYFELTIYEPFYHYVYLSNESDEFETFYLIKPTRQLDYFSCPNDTPDCNAAYYQFIEEYKYWWKLWYIDFKADYE